MKHSATYSPDDNKLRMYPACRLPKDEYDRLKAAGFKWAPKQELFVAPMWTPDREDLLIEFCGEISDDDKSLVDRAEERAERFEDYSDKRKAEADSAHATVETICNGIPLGQPILVGHHSERHARKDAERIENGMRKAVKLWETSQYWQQRAAGSIRLAKYKERPDVRARRIKGIEADKRKRERSKQECEKFLATYNDPEAARAIYKNPYSGECKPLFHAILDTYEGGLSYDDQSAFKKGELSYEDALAKAKGNLSRSIEYYNRWLAHYENRLAYERAMLADGGGLVGEQITAYEVGGRVNVLRYGWSLIVRVNKRHGDVQSLTIAGVGWRSIGLEEIQGYEPPAQGDSEKVKSVTKVPPLCNYPGEGFLHQTKEEWEKTVPQWSDFPKYIVVKATDNAGKHRVRNQREPGKEYWRTKPVFITDAKRVDPPAPSAPVKLAPFTPPAAEPKPAPVEPAPVKPDDSAKFEALREQAKAGVQVVSAPSLFPTPAALAAEMVEHALIESGHRILEPSAGTGNLLRALADGIEDDDLSNVVAVEINFNLAHNLASGFPKTDVRRTDFLECNGDLGKFDRILMNPPFDHGSDIKHIKHAMSFLNPGGRLVAICANGPRQQAELEPLAEYWEPLPAGTFSEQGTNVNTALLVIQR